jgi:aspartate aminotransferase/aminotransferase
MITPSPWAEAIPTQQVRAIIDLVMNRDDVLRLEMGQPNFPTPEHIVEAAVASVRAGSGYTYAAGTKELRAALAEHATEQTGLATAPEQVIVTQGGVQGVDLVHSLLVRAGDEVLIPDPAWPNFAMSVLLHGATPVPYPLLGEDGFQPDVDALEALISPRTSLLILNSPGNPTGTVVADGTVQRIVELAASRGIAVLSDEVYDALVFDGGGPANARRYAPDDVIALHSFSKTYAMTGWRVGWIVVPPHLAGVAERAQEPHLSCLPTFTQAGALAAITGDQQPLEQMLAAYQRRRDLAVEGLAAANVPFVRPSGAFYLMFPLAPGAKAWDATIDLIERQAVAVSPGTGYGQRSAGFLRLSMASSDDDLAEGVRRIGAWYHETKGGLELPE